MSKYDRIIKGVKVDVYDILSAFQVTDPALQHLLKKALCAGDRGHKDRAQDLQDIVDSALRSQAMHQEKEIALYENQNTLIQSFGRGARIGAPACIAINIVDPNNHAEFQQAVKSAEENKTPPNHAEESDIPGLIKDALSAKKLKCGDKIRELKLRLMAYEPRVLRYEAIRALDRLANAVDGQVPDGTNIKELAPGEVRLPALEDYFDTALDILKAEIDVTKHVDEVIKRSCKPGGMIYCAIRGIKN